MIDGAPDYARFLLFMGGVALLAAPVKAALGRAGLPALIGFVALGAALSLADDARPFLDDSLRENAELLARIGIVALLFKVGLESDLDMLRSQLGRAAAVWAPNMLVPAALVFALIWAWPGLGAGAALFAGVAASATSIGVSVAAWEDAGAGGTPDEALLLDAAELDDMSAVVLLSVLFAVAPMLTEGAQDGAADGAAVAALIAGAAQIGKLALFCAGCYLFSRYAERRLSGMFARLDPRLGPFLFAAGAVFLIAALADLMGFSVAIGALFAGLAFSRDPAERRIDEAFAMLLALFGPFFFVSIGLSVDFPAVGGALWLALALFAVASLGKLIGAGLPAAAIAGPRTGLAIGLSMIPRAEIFLIVMLHGLALGIVPSALYGAAVLTSLATCVLGPLAVARSLERVGAPAR